MVCRLREQLEGYGNVKRSRTGVCCRSLNRFLDGSHPLLYTSEGRGTRRGEALPTPNPETMALVAINDTWCVSNVGRYPLILTFSRYGC